MTVWVIVLLVLAALLVVLVAGGLAGNARANARRHVSLAERISGVDAQLAAARAADRGWEPEGLERAARAALESRGVQIVTLELIQVVDRPGTDEDRARFRATTASGVEEVQLARTGDRWNAV